MNCQNWNQSHPMLTVLSLGCGRMSAIFSTMAGKMQSQVFEALRDESNDHEFAKHRS